MEMTTLRVGDRVYHIRRGDRFAQRGYGRTLRIEGTRAKLLWESNGKDGEVERSDLSTEDEAISEGLT